MRDDGFKIYLRDRAWRRKWKPTPIFLPGESQGWRSLVGCRLWGRTESDTTEAMQQQRLFGLSQLGDVVDKNPPANAGETSSIPGPGRLYMLESI